MRKVLIIGVGGIGSYLAPVLDKTGLYDITIADPDDLEDKNFLYQNYSKPKFLLQENKKKVAQLDMLKANKVGFPILTQQQLMGFDLIVCCADNLDVRRLVYRQGFQEDCKNKWLDLRAQGRNGALISYLTDVKFSETFLTGPEGSFSCQGENFNETNDPKKLQFTHVAIAGYGAQWIQRWFDGDEVSDKIIINI
tara:strand:- start:20725 stop:21309 length:585 start_codon:yes stop_codon:yes gene_type:complete